MSLAGGSVFVGFAYQYFSIIGKNRFFHTKRGCFLISIGLFIYPFPTLALYLPSINIEAARKDVLQNFPHLYEYFVSASCNNRVNTWHFKLYLVVMFTQILGIFFAAFMFMKKIQNQLGRLTTSMPSAVIKVRRQLLLVLILQLMIPLLFIVVPLVLLLVLFLFKSQVSAGLFQYCDLLLQVRYGLIRKL